MASVETKYEHIVLEDGVPVIAGANMKVIELVQEKMAWGWSPEEMCYQHPHLSMGQIYSALAYYADHSKELDEDIERRLEFARQVEEANRPFSIVPKLKAKGLL